MVKKSEPAKNPTLTEPAEQRIWLRARLSLLLVALLSALPTPVSVMWGRSTELGWQKFTLPVLVALAWGGAIVLSQRELPGPQRHQVSLQSVANVRRLFFGLLLDCFFLTACLYLGGAAHNPFTLLYFVPITLSTFLSGRSPLMIAIISVAGFSLLLAKTAYFTGDGPHQQHLLLHIKGMAVALAVAGGLLTYFMRQIGLRLARQRHELSEMQRHLESDRAVTALGALAAGAAHELGSPLGTIQIWAEELPHLNAEERQAAQAEIVEQLARTKTILHSMLSSELSAAQIFDCEPLALLRWATDLQLECARSSAAEEPQFRLLGFSQKREEKKVKLPVSVIAQMVRELIKNAQKAQVNVDYELSLEALDESLQISIEDRGPGMTTIELEQAREPFISFSEGRGLGLFLIDVQVRQLGGQFELKSVKGHGTRAMITLPYQFNARLRT